MNSRGLASEAKRPSEGDRDESLHTPWNPRRVDAGIQRRQTALVMDGKSQQIDVRELLRGDAEQRRQYPTVGSGDRVFPELVSWQRTQLLQDGKNGGRRPRSPRVCRTAHDPKQTVFSQRTCRPSENGIVSEPLPGLDMMHMVGIAERNQEIDIEECHAPSSSISLLTSELVTRTPRAGRHGMPSSSVTMAPAPGGLALRSSRSRARVTRAAKVVRRLMATAFASRSRASGSSMVVFIAITV